MLKTAYLTALIFVLSLGASSTMQAQQAPSAVANANEKSAQPVNFRQPSVGIAEPQGSSLAGAAAKDSEELLDKKDALEAEVRYAKAKVDAAQKKMDIFSAQGNSDQVDRVKQELDDWNARYKSSKDQLDQVKGEIERAMGEATAAAAPAPTPSTQEQGHGQDDQLIVPGENLEIYINQDTSFNGRYLVRRGGYIIMPQIGRVMVAGRSLDQAESEVRRSLENSVLRKATVMIERISGLDIESGPLIYLSGEWKNPRPYKIANGTAATLVTVFLSSGGATDKADLAHVKIMRMAGGRGVTEEVNLAAILEGKSLTSDVTLLDGDVVTIPAGTANLVYITGNVRRAGSYRISSGERLTAYGAILQSGGFARFANEKGVHVLRAMPDGTKAKLPVDVRALKKGERPDLILQPGDIVVVPEKFWSF